MMITIYGKEISELSYQELKQEKRGQRWLLTRLKQMCKTQTEASLKESMTEEEFEQAKAEIEERWDNEELTPNEYRSELGRLSGHYAKSQHSEAVLLENYVINVSALIDEIDYWLNRRYEPTEGRTFYAAREARKRNRAKRKQNIAENARTYAFEKRIGAETDLIAWDKDKFLLITKDRGYQTEEGIVYAIAKELNLDRPRAKILIDRGRFTWGQVLCLGAWLEMTPKEFCDTFLSGYFVDTFGEFRASYDNLEKAELLKQVTRPMPTEPEEVDWDSMVDWDNMEIVDVGISDEPIVEEKWFD